MLFCWLPFELEKADYNPFTEMKDLQFPTSSLGLCSGTRGKISETASPTPQPFSPLILLLAILKTPSHLAEIPFISSAWEKYGQTGMCKRPPWDTLDVLEAGRKNRE